MQRMARHSALVLLLFVGSSHAFAQSPKVTKVEPPNWWSGMKWSRVQLMVYGENLGNVTARSARNGIEVVCVHQIANPAYALVDIQIADDAVPGEYTLLLEHADQKAEVSFPLLRREQTTGRHQGFGPRDVIYLITPDRFVDGDTTNDAVPGMLEGIDPDNPYGRHGGDIQGIIGKLDYLRDLGVTALWINPLLENNGRTSYHGYAATDLYNIDPRFGTNQLYRTLVEEAHSRGLKIIKDHVNNHIGINHQWLSNLPTDDWLNGTVDQHQKAYHGKIELSDIHSDSITKSRAAFGWFTDYMPDLNQVNPFVKNYLIQNTLWWIEYSGLDGIREDTYPYIDPRFASEWCAAILSEYPNFNIVGEVWVHDPVFLAPYQRGSFFPKTLDTNLPSVTDFGLFDAFMRVFAQGAGISAIYETLAKDLLYPDPYVLVTFLDNHDIQRIMHQVNGNVKRVRLALSLLLTTRGIPQLYYGTEIGLKGGKDHGRIREDFPGGFTRHVRSAFTPGGRTEQENDIFNYVRKLLQIRKRHPSVAEGTLTHLPPVNELYIFFRTSGSERIMAVANNDSSARELHLSGIRYYLQDTRILHDLMTDAEIAIIPGTRIMLEGDSAVLYLLKR